MRHAANESLAGWSTHQLQLNSWPLRANIESGLRKGQEASPMFANCGLAVPPTLIQLPANPGSEAGTKHKGGDDGRNFTKKIEHTVRLQRSPSWVRWRLPT